MKRSIYGRSFYSHEVTIKQSFPFVPTRWASTVLVFQWTKITPIMAENKNKWVFIGVINLYSWSYGPLLTTDFWFVRWPPPPNKPNRNPLRFRPGANGDPRTPQPKVIFGLQKCGFHPPKVSLAKKNPPGC